MPTNSPAYTREYERKNYAKRYKANKDKQVAAHKARRMLEKKHGKSAIKGKEVDHIKPLALGGKTTLSNLRVISKKANRSKGGRLKAKLYS